MTEEGFLLYSIPSVVIRIYCIGFADLSASLYRAIIVLPLLYMGNVSITFYLHKNGRKIRNPIGNKIVMMVIIVIMTTMTAIIEISSYRKKLVLAIPKAKKHF